MVYLAFGKKYKNDTITVQEVRDAEDTSVIVLHIEKGKGKDENPVMYIGILELRDSIKIVDKMKVLHHNNKKLSSQFTLHT